jgi:cell division septation protein DedD
MVVDYCERKQVNRNKPRQRSGGLYVIGLLAIVGVAYGLGFGSAWYFFRPARPVGVAPKSTPAVPKKAPEAAAPTVPPAAPAKGSDVPLTFYETLPKGSKSLIGTGLNPDKENVPQGARSAAKDAKPAAAPQLNKNDKITPPPAHDSGVDAAQGNPSPGKEPSRKSHEAFLVQVASTKERKEADDLVSKLVGKGVAAYLLESKVEGKGIWYRVRVGKHLTRQDAEAIAARLGKGALIIPE